MGNKLVKKLQEWFMKSFGNKEAKILMIGLDGAGKTCILYKLKLDENVTTIPTIGFNVEKVKYKNVSFTIWDIGGQDKLIDLWKYYFANNDAVIFVVDSNDVQRMDKTKNTLHKVLQDDQMSKAKVLLLANKQDLPNAMSATALSKKLQMSKIPQKDVFLQPTCALTGEGLFEGLDWLSSKLNKD